jgi:glyoxylase-like metal-dependent hydrolase (beta-lactamase superfamily II)
MKLMASARYDIISIGTLSRNRLWNESQAVRTAHATTTLIRTKAHRILVDPGLPAVALGARLFERTGLRPEEIDTVFLTNFRPAHRAGLAIFQKARVLIHENEQQWARQQIEGLLEQAPYEDLDRKVLEQELALLEKLQTAEDQLDESVDLFPLFGYTPGTSGLLVSQTTATILVAGDAVATQEHFLAGQVLPDAYDIQTAQESLQEVYEIADVIVPGHDNLFVNPRIHGI